VSQTLMAIPILVLYELGLLMCRLFITDEEEAAGTELSTTAPGDKS
jgi:Sec-independent protein secretion pathway component TatC